MSNFIKMLEDFFYIGGSIHSRHYQETIHNEEKINKIIMEIESSRKKSN